MPRKVNTFIGKIHMKHCASQQNNIFQAVHSGYLVTPKALAECRLQAW